MTDIAKSNPLYEDRAPRYVPKVHAPIVGAHFVTNPADISNDSFMNLHRGDFTYKKDPTIEIELAIWKDDQSDIAFRGFSVKTTKEGFNVAMAKDWTIGPRIKHMWQEISGGRIGIAYPNGPLVLLWRTGEKADEVRKRQSHDSDDVQKTVEQKMAEKAEAFSSATGIAAESRVVIEDDETVTV